MSVTRTAVVPMNVAPAGSLDGYGGPNFAAIYRRLHEAFAGRARDLVAARASSLAASRNGSRPDYLAPSTATTAPWSIELPAWCRDQRNQMTGPADDAELVVKMLNAGAPGVMLDLEDSIANTWDALALGLRNVREALYGTLTYDDRKRGTTVGIAESSTVLWTRVRGLHVSQAGVFAGETTPAPLFDLASLVSGLDRSRLRHPLGIYIPKSESPQEAIWWRDVFDALSEFEGGAHDDLRAMALVESHPLAYTLEEFAYELRERLLGLDLGRWDYMASLAHFTFDDPAWVLPDRNTIPHDVAFFQNLRTLMPPVMHGHGLLAIGGMTALFPSRQDAALNERALAVLAQDKKNEANCGMDGAWTGHPDQNAIAVAQFPAPNQLDVVAHVDKRPNLRPSIAGIGEHTVAGTRTAIRTVIRYRNGYLNGLGASLLDGFMEDLATDRIYRLMIAQRIRHGMHAPSDVTAMFDEELETLLGKGAEIGNADTLREARTVAETMIVRGEFDPT